jgi:hypothetical protein
MKSIVASKRLWILFIAIFLVVVQCLHVPAESREPQIHQTTDEQQESRRTAGH